MPCALRLAARRRHTGAAKPGNMTAGIVGRSLAHRQVAPDFHRGLGFPDVFEECDLAVKTAPAAGLEQLGEVVQPLLRKIAPACENVAAARHVESLCHKPAR